MEGTSLRTQVLETDLGNGRACWAGNLPADTKPGFNASLTRSQCPVAGGDLASLSPGFTQLVACQQGTLQGSEQVTQELLLGRVLTCFIPVSLPSQVSFSESGSLGNSSGSDVTSLSSQLPDTPNSMVPSPVET